MNELVHIIISVHLLSGILCVIYIYQLSDYVWCKFIFIRILNLRVSTLGCVTIVGKLLLVIIDFPILW